MPLAAVFMHSNELPQKSKRGSGPVRYVPYLYPVLPAWLHLTNLQEVDTNLAPFDVTLPGFPIIDTSLWGTPIARFTNSKCDIARKFGPENVIINLTFCACLLHVLQSIPDSIFCINHIFFDGFYPSRWGLGGKS